MNNELKDFYQGFINKDFRFLSKAISKAESHKKADKDFVIKLLELIPNIKKSKIIGFTGSPGAGKSTTINSLGLKIVESSKTLGVLTIDPSSEVTGGSILGDKTRMHDLTHHKDCFIRPSASQSIFGGVAPNTYYAIALCEKFGLDYIFVESVGVGQSENHIVNLVDVLVFILSPAGGDELQGIKRGILEQADILLVNKWDSDLKNEAEVTADQFTHQNKTPILYSAEKLINLDLVLKAIDKNFSEKDIEIFRNTKKVELVFNICEQRILVKLKSLKKSFAQKHVLDIEQSIQEVLLGI
jgi:LAO/AO transport system kinase